LALFKAKAHWAKLTKPGKGYKNPKTGVQGVDEWSVDLSIDEATKKALLGEGLDPDKIKNKGDDRGDFVQYKRKITNAAGESNQPIRVVGPDDKPWGSTLIGNGSDVFVKYTINDGGRLGVFAIKISKLVEYTTEEKWPEAEDKTVNSAEDWSES